MDFEWEAPPEEALLRRGHPGQYLDIAIELRKHPGKWAKVSKAYKDTKSAQTAAQNFRRGIPKGFEKDEFDAVPNGNHVFLMYKGPVEKDEPEDPSQPAADASGRDAAGGTDDEHGWKPQSFAPKIRAWAREHNIEVAGHGRLPRELIDMYFEDTGEPMPPHLRAVP